MDDTALRYCTDATAPAVAQAAPPTTREGGLAEPWQALLPEGAAAPSLDRYCRSLSALFSEVAHSCQVPPAEVEGLLQEAWQAIVERQCLARPLATLPELRAWVLIVMRNKAVEIWCRRKRQAALSPGASVAARQAPRALDDDPAAQVERRWRQKLVQLALEDLCATGPELTSRAAWMRWVDGHSPAAIAAALGLELNAVWSRLRSARQHLRAFLASYIEDPAERRDF
jgi:DNA-directed RNA polymerase specialized sigma24 family protein